MLHDYVYVRQLDVFGKIVGLTYKASQHQMFYKVLCEAPMPNFEWEGTAEFLALESEYR